MKYIVDVLIAGGGGAAVAFLMIKAFGAKILDHKFSKMIEHYKLKLNLEFDRVAKLNQKEFEVLPLLWEKIVLLRNNILFFADTGKRVFFDLNSLNSVGLIDFVNGIPVPQHLKEFILQSDNKNEAYKKVVEADGLEAMKNLFNDFDRLYKLNKIFLTNALRNEISDIHKYYFETIGIFMDLPNNPELKAAFRSDFDSISLRKTENISILIKKRLRFEDEEI